MKIEISELANHVQEAVWVSVYAPNEGVSKPIRNVKPTQAVIWEHCFIDFRGKERKRVYLRKVGKKGNLLTTTVELYSNSRYTPAPVQIFTTESEANTYYAKALADAIDTVEIHKQDTIRVCDLKIEALKKELAKY